MATVSSYTSAALDSLLAGKGDLAGGILVDAQAPAIAMKKDTWVVDINDHGGVADGVTANDAAFISALSVINPTWGGKLVLEAGSYLINGTTAITLATHGTTIEGVGTGATKIVIGSGFTGTTAINITANDCKIVDLSIVGESVTTTSNPVADAIDISSVSRAKISRCNFYYINGWAIQAVAGVSSGTNPTGTMLSEFVIKNCAGGVHLFGNAGSGSVSMFLTDIQIIANGVASGTSANLDGVKLEDAWNVNVENLIVWMTAGTGSGLHIKGACISTFIKTIDCEGSTTAPAVLIEDGPNGSPYTTQIDGGTIQLGTIGLRMTGAARVTHLSSLNIVANKTHGLSVESTGSPVYGHDLYFTGNGSGASGSNYDINWTGAATGSMNDCRFETSVVAVSTAGVQNTVNMTAGHATRFVNSQFAGTGATHLNWFTGLPAAVLDSSTGAFNFLTSVAFSLGLVTQGVMASQPSASTGVIISSNIGGVASNDTFRLTGDGAMSVGAPAGGSARDTTWGRQAAAQFGTPDSDIVIGLAGKGLRIKEGSNARMGTATLVAAVATIANTSITANTRIFVGTKTPSANTGALFVHDVTVGTSFTVHSTNGSDTSVVSWVLIEAD